MQTGLRASSGWAHVSGTVCRDEVCCVLLVVCSCRMRESRGETEIRRVNLEKENQNLKHERRRLDNKLAQVQK